MQLQKAQRNRAKIKMALQGPSGSGKTFSSLEIARGLSRDWSSVAVIDTEHASSHLYSHLGNYSILELSDTFSPERYIQAIETCEKAGMEVIILDSISPEWDFLIDFHANLPGNSFSNWSKVNVRHNSFLQKILSSPCHIICTLRTKSDYAVTEKNGKLVPEKIGLKAIQKDTFEFEMTLVFDLDIKNYAVASKDRTGLFYGKPEQKLSIETGRLIAEWCNSGDPVSVDDMSARIESCLSIQELLTLYKMFPQYQEALKPEFEKRKRQLVVSFTDTEAQVHLANLKISPNGKH